MGNRIYSTLALAALVGACDAQSAQPQAAQATVLDSAGVLLVSVGPLEHLGPRRWAAEPVWDTNATGVDLFRVSAARILPDDRVVAGNSGNSEVLILDADGQLVQRVGRDGDGPGEFRAITSIHTIGRGFAVFDTRLGRWSEFDRDGGLVSTVSMMPPDRVVDLLPLAVSAEGQLLGVLGAQRRFAHDGIRRDTTPLLQYSEPGAIPDTIGVWAATEWSYSSSGEMAMRTPVGFGRNLAVFGRDSIVALGDTEDLTISVFDASGRLRMRISGGGPRRSPTQAEVEQWRDNLLSELSPRAPEAMVEAYRDAPFRDSYPAFSDVAVEGNGRVWIGTQVAPDAGSRPWVVVGADGEPEGRIDLPAHSEVVDVGAGRLLLLSRDELGVETLSLINLTPEN